MLILFLSLLIFADEQVILSKEGYQVLEKHVAALETTMHQTEENITKTNQNLEVVLSELEQIAQLEKEHLALSSKHQSIVEKLKKEIAKNEQALAKVTQWEKTTVSNKDLVLEESQRRQIEAQLDVARQEKADRENWKVGAIGKIKQSEEFLRESRLKLNTLLSLKPQRLEEKEKILQAKAQYEKDLATLRKQLDKTKLKIGKK